MTETPHKLLRRGHVERRLGVSRWTLARIIHTDPTFPGFFELSPGIEVIRQDRLEAWLRLREIEARVPRDPTLARTRNGRAAPSAPSCNHTHVDADGLAAQDLRTGPRGADEGSTHHEAPAETPGPPRRA